MFGLSRSSDRLDRIDGNTQDKVKEHTKMLQ